MIIKIQDTRFCVCFSLKGIFHYTAEKAKADPLLFLREQIYPFTTMRCTGLATARDFVLLPTSDAFVRVWIQSAIGLPPSQLGLSQFQARWNQSRIVKTCMFWSEVWEHVWWPENLLPPPLLDWENLTLHWEKLHKRQSTLYRHSCGIHGKEEWGEKPYCTPEDLIERDLGNDEEQLNFNCPEKQKLDLLDVKKYSSVILELRLERLEPNYTSQESLFLQTL